MPGGATFFTASAVIPLRSIPADAVKNIWYPRYYRVVHFLTSATGTLLNQRVVHFGVDKHNTFGSAFTVTASHPQYFIVTDSFSPNSNPLWFIVMNRIRDLSRGWSRLIFLPAGVVGVYRKVPKIRHFFSYVGMRWTKSKGFWLSSGTSLVSFSDTADADWHKVPDLM